MKRIFVPTLSGTDWQQLLAKPKLHWKSGRSAMTAAACWEASTPQLPEEIIDVLAAAKDEAFSNLELLAAMPEWEVDLPGGDRPSQTDILALTRNDTGMVVLGVEAKVDEPFGPTLGEKRDGASPGQNERLAYLEEMLCCNKSFDDSIRYQLLHRTVSALLTAKAFHASVASMLFQSFSPASKWRGDFEAFAQAMSARPVTPDLYELELSSAPRLLIGWCCGAKEFLSVELPSAH